jgi:hypothetical protein
MGDRLAPGSDIEGIRIGQEGFPFIFLHPVNDLSQKDGPDIGGIPFFSEVEFDRDQIFLFDFSFKISSVEKGIELIEECPFRFNFQVRKEDMTFHRLSSVPKF